MSSFDLAARLEALVPPELTRGDWEDVTARVRLRRRHMTLRVTVAFALFVALAAAATATYLVLRVHSFATPAPGELTLVAGGGSVKTPPELVEPRPGGLRVVWRCHGSCALMTSADWAPDGRHLAFTLDAFNGRSRSFGLHILDTQTGRDRHIGARESTRLGCTLFGYDRSSFSQVSWSPDGRTLAFVCAGEIRTIRQDGTHLRTVQTGLTPSGSPTWSPDGTRIAFDARGAIYVMRLDGSGRTSIVRHGSHPDWSPDGARIAYRVPTGIRFVTPAGVDVTPHRRPIEPAGIPAWSPDGTRLAVAAPTGVVILPAAGGPPRFVTDRAGVGVHPAWYPDRRARRTRGTSTCGEC